MNWAMTAAGFGVGTVVGLTGMGGGALMTPILVIFFGIPPLAAVSSDLVASAVMKPVGSAVHIRRGTVRWNLVGWLCLGSIPGAFGGVLVLRALGGGDRIQSVVKVALGVALLLAVVGLAARAYTSMREHSRGRAAGETRDRRSEPGRAPLSVRPVPTVLLGLLGGLVVGMTSVGSGSLIIVVLLMLYPMLRPGDLVGTDLVQAVPLVAAAAIGHLLFGDFRFSVTSALLLGSVPGVFLGAQISSRARSGLVRRALAFILLASALKLLITSTVVLATCLGGALVVGPLVWMALRRRNGLPALARTERTTERELAPAGLAHR